MSFLATSALPKRSEPAGQVPPAHRLSDADDREIRALLRARSMSGRIQVGMTREPSFQAAADVESVRHAVFVDRHPSDGHVVALGTRSVRPVYFAGKPTLVGYLGQLRIEPHASGIKRLRAGFDHLAASRQDDELPFDLTSIVADNLPARRLLERGLRGLPIYRPLTTLETLVLSTRDHPLRRSAIRPAGLRPATWADLHELERLLASHNPRYDFAPVWTARDLEPNGRTVALRIDDWRVIEREGRIIACAAVWDQRSFKQTVITGYTPWLDGLRPALNLGLRALGQPTLPRAPSTLAMAYVSHLAAPDVETALALIAALREQARERGIEQLALTLAQEDPRCSAVKRHCAARSYPSVLYAVHPAGRSFAAESLPTRIPFLEAATL